MNRMKLLETVDSLIHYGKKVRRLFDKSENARDVATAIFVPGGPAIVAAKRWKRKAKMNTPQTPPPNLKNSRILRGRLLEVESVDFPTRGSTGIYRRARVLAKRTIPQKLKGAADWVGRGVGAAVGKAFTGRSGVVGGVGGLLYGAHKGFKEPEPLQASLRLKYGNLREDDDEIEMKKSEFKKEHKHLFKVLRKCKHKSCKKELKKQKKEYKDEMKESVKSRHYLNNLIESSPKKIADMAKDAYGRPMLGNLRSSINPSAKSAGDSFAKAAKRLKSSSMSKLLYAE